VEKSERVSGEIFEILGHRRQRLSQAKVRSTTQRRGRSSNPFADRSVDDFDLQMRQDFG